MEKESHSISDEPQKMPFKLLADITDGFSEKAKIGSGAFGQVYKVCKFTGDAGTLPEQFDPCFLCHE